jgi:hypothetical protein
MPKNHGTEISTKEKLDRTRNATVRVATQTRTDHWRSAIFLKRIRKRATDQVLAPTAPPTAGYLQSHTPPLPQSKDMIEAA